MPWGSCHRPLDKILRVSVLLPSRQTKFDPHDLAYHNPLDIVVPAVELVGLPWGGDNSKEEEEEEDSRNDDGFLLDALKVERSPRFHEILPGWSLEVTRGDTNCSSTEGPLKAFEFHCQAGRTEKKKPP